MKRVAIIGAGFSGLSAACHLARQGHKVTVFEKHRTPGGRARSFSEEGFTFDMGPSWYWMPDIFEKFFQDFGHTASDFYELKKLDPAFQVFYEDNSCLQIPSSVEELQALFESIEPGSGAALDLFLQEAEKKYRISMKELIYSPGLSILEYIRPEILGSLGSLQLFSSLKEHVAKYFRDERLRQLMEFPVLFLGAMPSQIPALYSLMNHAAFNLGTWYPMGGMYKIVEAMTTIASNLGVDLEFGEEAKALIPTEDRVVALRTTTRVYEADAFVASADYAHVERNLLDKNSRNYDDKYWKGRTLAPSCLIYYVGLNKTVKKLLHHNLFFDTSFSRHADEIYKDRTWPVDPLFYVCCPGKTDPSVAPPGHENLFILIPVADDLGEKDETRQHYFEKVIQRIEKRTGESIREHIVYQKSYGVQDFKTDYHALRGNAYGLSNILRQTAILKPAIKNKKLQNLYYAGHLTVPGPGVPPALISGKIAATLVNKYLKQKKYESAF